MAHVLKALCTTCRKVFLMNPRHVVDFRVTRGSFLTSRHFSDSKFRDPKSNEEGEEKPKFPRATDEKFEIFEDDDSPVILDMHEEKQKRLAEGEADPSGWSKRLPRKNQWQSSRDIPEILDRATLEITSRRDRVGVLAIEELVGVLQSENAVDLCVISVPPEFNYADFIVIVTGRSLRHMQAVAEYVRKLYKTKRSANDIIPRIEGKTSNDWMALDLGNIILHIFTDSARKRFDLETLWAAGSQHDDLANKEEDPVDALFHEYSLSFQDLKFGSDEAVSSDTLELKFTSYESISSDESVPKKAVE